MIIKTYILGNTKIKISDECKLKSEEERKLQIENFNKIGNKIIQNSLIMKGEKNEVK